MSRTNNTSKIKIESSSNVKKEADGSAGIEYRKQAAQSDIVQRPSKNKDKRA